MSNTPHYTLAGRTAFVSGGASGIGLACVTELARRGARVVVADLNEPAAQQVAEDVNRHGGQALASALDVTNEESVSAALDRATAWAGALDIAVNSAAVASPPSPVGQIELADWSRTIAVNLTGVFLSMREQISAMRPTGGSIINIGSVLATVASQSGSGAYVAAKHALVGLTKQAAVDHASDGIRVNIVLPGYVETPLLIASSTEEQRRDRVSRHPIGRMAGATEIAGAVCWLADDTSSFVTGASIPVDGGYTAV